MHLGGCEFRFAGWTDERTIRFAADAAGAGRARVFLCTRAADRAYRAELPAQRL